MSHSNTAKTAKTLFCELLSIDNNYILVYIIYDYSIPVYYL